VTRRQQILPTRTPSADELSAWLTLVLGDRIWRGTGSQLVRYLGQWSRHPDTARAGVALIRGLELHRAALRELGWRVDSETSARGGTLWSIRFNGGPEMEPRLPRHPTNPLQQPSPVRDPGLRRESLRAGLTRVIDSEWVGTADQLFTALGRTVTHGRVRAVRALDTSLTEQWAALALQGWHIDKLPSHPAVWRLTPPKEISDG
jgi:hypothetical protein